MSETVANHATIDLAKPRVLALHGSNGLDYELVCRRARGDDWNAYYSALYVASQRVGGDLVNLYDVDTARRVLVERLLIAASGYVVEGGIGLSSLSNWQGYIPLAHKLKAGQILASVTVDERFDDMIYPDGEPVFLSAIWSAGGDGGMQQVKGLKHVMRLPSDAQQRQYQREASRSIVLGDRSGTTVYPGVQPLLATLYDELIVSVEGYTLDGAELSGRENIAREMDTHHKVVVAQQIFAPRTQVVVSQPKKKDDEQ